MSDSYTTEETVGYGSRLKSSLSGALFGLLLLVAAFPLEFWNEGRAVAEHRALEEGASAVVETTATPLDPATEGKLVHVSAEATAAQTVQDPDFGVSTQALALLRKVQMYQWKERKETKREKQLGGSEKQVTHYTYERTWSDERIDSSHFHDSAGHANPARLPFESRRVDAAPVRLGDLVLAPDIAGRIDGEQPLVVAPSSLPPNLAATFQGVDGELVTSKDARHPEIGDVRVRFSRIPEQVVSVIGVQRNGRIEPYSASNGREIALLQTGDVPAARMFQAAEERNNLITWVLRGVGVMMMWIGLCAALGPIARLLDVVPFLGSLVETGVAIAAALLAFVLSLLTIAVAWFFYRPLLAGGLIALAILAVVLLRRRAQTPPPPPPAAGFATPPPPPPRRPA